MSVYRLPSALLVEAASGKFVPIRKFMKNIVMDLNGNKFHEELLPYELNGFNILLGINWLSMNDAEILCRKKMVRVNPLGREPFTVYGEKH